ncbi:MAG: NAD(P)/FAD-dependent oxidoreductase [Geodermatophilaceae bacterium]
MSDSGKAPRCLIAGGGQAAAQVAISLRHVGYAGEITVIGDEPTAPYQRPPLSKAYLKGEISAEQLRFRPAALYEKLRVELRTGQRVVTVDRDKREIELDGGEHVPFDWLVLSTGARPRPLSVAGAEIPRLLALRTLADADRLRDMLTPGRRLLIVGAGYLGLEVAAVAARLGVAVTVLEAGERVLARVAGCEVAEFLAAVHADAGVKIVIRTTVRELLRGPDGAATGVVCSDGRSWAADLVLVAVGVAPEVELAEAAGLPCDNGIMVDGQARTRDPRIYAAGDCTNQLDAASGRRLRLESVNNAVEQGKTVAAAITGSSPRAAQVPCFWSDQYHVKLQTVGVLAGHAASVVRGDPAHGSFAVLYLDDGGHVVAVDAVNAPREFSFARSLLGRRPVGEPLPSPDAWPRVKSATLPTLLGKTAVL